MDIRMDDSYTIDCGLCETITEVIVDSTGGSEPEYCPMCGTPIIPE
jgi:hypothetical protein